jgi:hypothetical protein
MVLRAWHRKLEFKAQKAYVFKAPVLQSFQFGIHRLRDQFAALSAICEFQ